MKRKAAIAVLIAALALSQAAWGQASASAQATVSEKKDVAVFALGYQGWILPLEALGAIDSGIQKVFADLGRFNVIGLVQRLSSSGLSDFIQAIRKSKEAGFVLPEKYQFGEAVLTEAEFNRLLGAFIVAVPVITSFDSRWNTDRSEWRTSITTSVSFLDVASGSLLGVAEVGTSGTDPKDQAASMREALDAIPSGLEYKIRSIPAFQISSRVLELGRGELRMQLGTNMGIVKGDEYAVTREGSLQGIRDVKEIGLVVVKEVGPEISTAVILIDDGKIAAGDQLKQIPRAGGDLEPFIHAFAVGPAFVTDLGLRAIVTRGFYSPKFFVYADLPFGVPSSAPYDDMLKFGTGAGGQFDLHLGRLGLNPWAALGPVLALGSSDTTSGKPSTDLTHFGGQAWIQASWLASRDMRFFGEVGAGWWFALGTGVESFGGLGLGGGLALKL